MKKRPQQDVDLKMDITGKEFNFNDSLNKEADRLFTEEISWIKNDFGVIKKKDNSEIYDQWLNESHNGGNIPGSEWTFKVPQWLNHLDSSVDSALD